MTEEYRNNCQRTVENLSQAQRCLQQAQMYIGFAIKCNTLNGNERKILGRVKVNLIDPIDEIEVVRNAINILLR